MVDRLEDKLDTRLDRIESKLEKVSESTTKNTLVLDEHSRRTEAAEAVVDVLSQSKRTMNRRLPSVSGLV